MKKYSSIFLVIIFLLSAVYIYDKKEMKYWFASYLKWEFTEKIDFNKLERPIHIMFFITDHFEPTTVENMTDWYDKYLKLVKNHKDSDGENFKYTWFYFYDGFKEEIMTKLVELSKMGLGEIELHLHHKNDTPESFRKKIKNAKKTFRKYGALYTIEKKYAFGYIAGNWALDNSIIINGRNFSGVNNELQILKEEGCYADFTFPSVNMAQPKLINKIYYAFENPLEPKSYNNGIIMERLKTKKFEMTGLVIFEGILRINWKDWKHIFYPSIEDGQILFGNPPSRVRVDSWIKTAVHVKGKPNWIFVKIFTHGASPKNKKILFGGSMDEMLSLLESKYNDGVNYKLHYVTAREAFNIAKAAEYGLSGDPNEYRDFIIKPYLYSEGK